MSHQSTITIVVAQPYFRVVYKRATFWKRMRLPLESRSKPIQPVDAIEFLKSFGALGHLLKLWMPEEYLFRVESLFLLQ